MSKGAQEKFWLICAVAALLGAIILRLLYDWPIFILVWRYWFG